MLALYNLDKPVIAAVRGAVYGIGNALALACDLVLASDTAKFSMAFKKVGVVPDGGAIFFLTQRLGIARAKELVYTARVGPGRRGAEAWASRPASCRIDKLEARARALAQELAESATYALALAKKMFHSMYVPTLEQLLEMETLASGLARLTPRPPGGRGGVQGEAPAEVPGQVTGSPRSCQPRRPHHPAATCRAC